MTQAHSVTSRRKAFNIDYERDLNPQQLQAVKTTEGPVLVIAGAGSGKTRTLVYRVAWLIENGIPPESILLLTFTRKAAATMLQRASSLLKRSCDQVSGGTFHGFAHRMLRQYAPLVGYPTNFTIMDRADVLQVLRYISNEMGLTGTGRRFPPKKTMATIATRMANRGSSLEELLESDFSHLEDQGHDIAKVLSAYATYKKEHHLMDYDDLLLLWRKVLRENREVRQNMGRKFNYIMVDEYQDTNPAQAEIVRLMACGHDNVMVVGDDAQSIYAFRGASFKNILEFPNLFTNCSVIKLVRNYRSTQPNLDCTNAIIAHAREKFAKKLIAHRKGGSMPVVFRSKDEGEQAIFVADRIQDFLSKGTSPEKIAVLFRAGFHSYQLEAELNRRGLAFEKRGGIKLVEAAHIKDFLCLLRLTVNPYDPVSWTRVLIMIEGLGPKGINRILTATLGEPDPLNALRQYKTRSRWKNQVHGLASMLLSLRKETRLPKILESIKDWICPLVQNSYAGDYPRRLIELQQLCAMADNYDDAATMLADLALDPPENTDTSKKKEKKLVLSTIHSAKGLEWDVVFMISLVEGRFPASGALKNDVDIEEERRLFYVGSTRARDHIFYCFPSLVNVSGYGSIPADPSRFLNEIPAELMKPWNPDTSRKGHTFGGSSRYTDDSKIQETGTSLGSGNKFRPGQRVRHPIFGPGKVIQMINDKKIKICFDRMGYKTLHMDYAKISII